MGLWGWTAIGVVLGVAAVWICATLFGRRRAGGGSVGEVNRHGTDNAHGDDGYDRGFNHGLAFARRSSDAASQAAKASRESAGSRRPRDPERESAARQDFQLRREWLEARFFTLASSSGKPRGLTWVDCDFDDEVVFARERRTGELRALVGLTIRFEAIEGGGMEDNPNVANLRAATAVFHHRNGAWETDGRSVFNLTPEQTVDHYQHELERT